MYSEFHWQLEEVGGGCTTQLVTEGEGARLPNLYQSSHCLLATQDYSQGSLSKLKILLKECDWLLLH